MNSAKLVVTLLAGVVAIGASPAARPQTCTADPDSAANTGCAAGMICMVNNGNQCLPAPAPAPLPGLLLPFDAQTNVICTHSNGTGSHASVNAFYALDFDSAYDQPPVVIRAAADGKAFVFGSDPANVPCSSDPNTACALCPPNPGTPESNTPTTCGDGWGNRIKILHASGYFTFYAHLDHALVNTGDMVKQGDAIAIEGQTGLTGERQLHWSVNQLPGIDEADWEQNISFVPQSVPFSFHAFYNGANRTITAPGFQCPHAAIGQAPAGMVQPALTGVH